VLVAIDAKKSGYGWRHGVELSSAAAAEEFEAWTGIAEFLVFPDGCVARPLMVLKHGTPGPKPSSPARGSGTPYHLISCADCMTVDDVFGATIPEAV